MPSVEIIMPDGSTRTVEVTETEHARLAVAMIPIFGDHAEELSEHEWAQMWPSFYLMRLVWRYAALRGIEIPSQDAEHNENMDFFERVGETMLFADDCPFALVGSEVWDAAVELIDLEEKAS